MQSCQIGISVYRQPLEWLIRAVESAQSQVARNTIWIRIDGPTACDVQCRSWLKRAAATNPSIILIEGRERLGTFASYREIFSCDGSDFLCQLDADDWLESNAISSCMEALAENPDAPFAYTNYREITDDGRHIRPGKRSLEQFDHSKMLVQFITFHLRVIRRKAYIMTGGYDPSLLYAGDYDLSLKLCEQGTPVHVNRIVYNYRIHDRNTSFNKRQQTILEAFSVAQGALERRRLNHLFRLELEAGASRVHLRHRLGPIVIAGMHRSGTSVLALMLQHLGMEFGSKLLAADQFNPDGYLEDETIIALHRGWLQQNHQGSEGWPDWGWKVDTANFEVPAPTAAWLLKAREYLNHRNQSTIPWGWKDPRSTLFLEQWLSLDPGLRVIGIYRHPWEIIDALQRVRPPIFLKHPNWGLAIWCQYNRLY